MIAYSAAADADLPDIAALLAQTDMNGTVGLSFRADLAAGRVMAPGMTAASVIGREGDRLAGMASRIVAPGFWRGAPARIGWVAQLRLPPSHRHRPRVLTGGFDAFRAHLHDAAETPWYMASILSANTTARRLLERGLPGFPRFTPVATFRTLVFRTRRGPATGIRQARPQDASRLVAFLNGANAARPLAFAFEADEDFAPGRFPGLSLTDFLLAEDGDRITGAVALWDQRPLRAVVVTRYARPLAMLRPLANGAAPVLGLPHLPPPGTALRMGFAAFLTAEAPATALALLTAARALGKARGLDLVTLGLCADDPVLPALCRPRHRVEDARLYTVTWRAGESAPAPGAFRLAKPEAALL